MMKNIQLSITSIMVILTYEFGFVVSEIPFMGINLSGGQLSLKSLVLMWFMLSVFLFMQMLYKKGIKDLIGEYKVARKPLDDSEFLDEEYDRMADLGYHEEIKKRWYYSLAKVYLLCIWYPFKSFLTSSLVVGIIVPSVLAILAILSFVVNP
jgi:hypothetical protein